MSKPDVYEHKSTLECIMYLGGTVGDAGVLSYRIDPVDDFTYDEVHDKEVRDSITEGNIQVIHKWPRWTFEITVPATAYNIGLLQWALTHNQKFSIQIKAVEDGGYNPLEINFEGCYVTRKTERDIANDVPMMTFSCLALRGSAGGISSQTLGGSPFSDWNVRNPSWKNNNVDIGQS